MKGLFPWLRELLFGPPPPVQALPPHVEEEDERDYCAIKFLLGSTLCECNGWVDPRFGSGFCTFHCRERCLQGCHGWDEHARPRVGRSAGASE